MSVLLRLDILLRIMEEQRARRMVQLPQQQERTGRAVNSSASSSFLSERTLFFHTIPQELHDNVLRFLSLLPHAVNWGVHIPLRNLVDLCRVNGGLGTFLARFHMLCISKTVRCVHERRRHNWQVPDEGMLWMDSIDYARDFVIGVGGESIRAIIIGYEVYDEVRDGRDMAEDFLAACPNVSSLSMGLCLQKTTREASSCQ